MRTSLFLACLDASFTATIECGSVFQDYKEFENESREAILDKIQIFPAFIMKNG